jgi:hypothetical protein
MTTYRTRDGQELERYEKFTNYIAATADVTWIPLLVSKNRVRYFESSQLVEVIDPRLTGMVYCYPAEPQNFDSGLDYCYPQEAPLVYTCEPPPQPLTVVLTPEMAASVNASALVSIVVREPVTLWTPAMREAA